MAGIERLKVYSVVIHLLSMQQAMGSVVDPVSNFTTEASHMGF